MAHKTSAMVEAGILAAIAIVFALISTYIPVFGMLINFIWALPIVLCGMRNGLRWSIMTLIVSGIVIAMLLNPLNALMLVAVFGLLGIVLGECMRRKLAPLKLLGITSVAALASMVISVLLTFFVLGSDPIAMFFGLFDQALADLASVYQGYGLSEEQILAATNSAQDSFKLIRLVLPGSFLLSAPLLAFMNYWAAKAVLTKLGERFESFPPFINLALPKWILVPYILSLIVVIYFEGQDTLTVYLVALNIQLLCNVIFVFQGLAVAFWYIKNKDLPKWWGKIAVALVFISQFVSQYVVFVGAFDLLFDFRKLKSNRNK
ncbi:MAG TPA: YybS family protein [Candidatus Avacidaminococcus intestinavium]|uniref:YybS family protein n=1 Tax=Candidatus Avacidaminococcus intestinavium TaxID=2840684 RepID=A0A9D1MR81_9FIRM|nr:YybS family protein [Candidatus Avacidaminococcus intestinavium]